MTTQRPEPYFTRKAQYVRNCSESLMDTAVNCSTAASSDHGDIYIDVATEIDLGYLEDSDSEEERVLWDLILTASAEDFGLLVLHK